jgi:hypothetical protein
MNNAIETLGNVVEQATPNIETDRICLLAGGVAFGVQDVPRAAVYADGFWMSLVSAVPDAEEKEFQDGTVKHLRDHFIRIVPQVYVGTVAELVERYRESLTQLFENGVSYLRLPATMQEAMGVTGLTVLSNGNEALERRQALLQQVTGMSLQQTALERDVLKRLVVTYTMFKMKSVHYPGDRIEDIDRLIAALTVLKEDHHAARGETPPTE